MPTLQEVADAAVFLASDRASAMTGTIVNLTRGSITPTENSPRNARDQASSLY
jgi:enoyl-[acyl-carrier-protein] reductase (NADH)